MAILVDEQKLESLIWDFAEESLEWPHDFSVAENIAKIIEECKKPVDNSS